MMGISATRSDAIISFGTVARGMSSGQLILGDQITVLTLTLLAVCAWQEKTGTIIASMISLVRFIIFAR
jgi:hypothetical protein